MEINGKKVVFVPTKSNPLEKVIEKTVTQYAKSLGYYVRKFNSVGRRSVPDAIFINSYRFVFFIEFKRLGKKSTPAQLLEHHNIMKTGIHVFVVDNIAQGKNIVFENTYRSPV